MKQYFSASFGAHSSTGTSLATKDIQLIQCKHIEHGHGTTPAIMSVPHTDNMSGKSMWSKYQAYIETNTIVY